MGDRGSEVRALYGWLREYGYFPNSALARDYPGWKPVVPSVPRDPSRYDSTMARAVRLYQRRHGLPETGAVTKTMLTLLRRPRCGVPDRVPLLGWGAKYNPSGYKWDKRDLKWGLMRGLGPEPHEVTEEQLILAIQRAVGEWEGGSEQRLHINRYQGQDQHNADIKIAFHRRGHRCLGFPTPDRDFDGQGNVSGHAFFPPPNGKAGCTHLDLDENWSTDPLAVPGRQIDLQSVLTHEIGHALGLDHTTKDETAVMWDTFNYEELNRDLKQDDKDGIRFLYPKT
jgi:hypothetical protein